MTPDLARLTDWVGAAALAFAAGYLIATRRRSPRAAWLGLLGVAVLGLWLVQVVWAVGVADPATEMAVLVWTRSAHLALGHGLLVWAVLVDRPPAADE